MSETSGPPESGARRPGGGRPRRRRLASWAAALVMIVGALLVADAATTLLWQEPVSALRAWHAQRELGDRLDQELRRPLGAREQRALRRVRGTDARLAVAARQWRERTPEGQPLGRISLPSLGGRYVLVAGDAEDDLRKGPGVYPSSRLPGEGATTAVAGHRTTYLAPFRHIDRLRDGDRIVLEMPYGTFTYAVEGRRVVEPEEVGVVRDVGRPRLVLTACHPLHSAAQRIVVFARLVGAQPDPGVLEARQSAR